MVSSRAAQPIAVRNSTTAYLQSLALRYYQPALPESCLTRASTQTRSRPVMGTAFLPQIPRVSTTNTSRNSHRNHCVVSGSPQIESRRGHTLERKCKDIRRRYVHTPGLNGQMCGSASRKPVLSVKMVKLRNIGLRGTAGVAYQGQGPSNLPALR